MKTILTSIGLGSLLWLANATAEIKDVPHPFLLWTREEAAAIRQRIESDPLAKKQYAKMAATEISKVNPTLWNLFNYLVMGDEAAGQREKGELLKFIGRLPEPMTEAFKAKLAAKIAEVGGDYDKIWTRGNSSVSDSHQRDEQTLNTLRYDVLYDLLSPEERDGIEKSLRAYIQFHLDGAKPRHPDFHYTRMGWLPNMHWPRPIGTHLMAVALKDEKAIAAMFNSEGGWKWFFDDYITDGQFYNEEFCKYYSNIGTMLLYCEALEHLGLSQFGYGYTGKGGATMKNLLYMPIKVGFPRLNVTGATMIPGVTMGDAGAFFTVNSPHGPGKPPLWWSTAHMNGPFPKLQAPGWYEIGHARWPDAGFGYFLGQMRQPDEEVYLPSLYFGVGPIDPKKVSPPPAPSYVTRERGFALLRAEESPAYWESPKPAVAMQFGMYYVHYVHDCLAMLNYVALNRTIYERMGGVGKGYAGGDPWRDHVAGQSNGIVVDGLKANPVDSGEDGCRNQRIREHLAGPAKFVACRAKGIYPGVDMERAFILTGDYLCDISWLQSDKPRVYDWHVLSAGKVVAPETWQPAAVEKPVITEQKSFEAGDKPWTVVIHQHESPDQVGGVHVSMLNEAGTTVTQGRPPIGPKGLGVKVVASRTKPATVFAALHEPYNGPATQAPAAKFERIAQTEGALAAGINNDRVLLAMADAAGKEQTLAGNGESFTFTDFGFVRVGKDKVEVTGNVKSLQVKVTGAPKLVVNGTERPYKPASGMIIW
jgi:hypothetical protein